MGWAELAAAFVAFLLTHVIPVRPPVRPWLVARLGRRGFTLAYSLLSVAVLAWLIVAAGRAPYLHLWAWAPWQNHIPLAGMLVASLITALAIGRPNPFSFGGTGNEGFDPPHPGVIRWMRHPLLVAAAIWAFAHMVPNGDLAHLLLFGSFGAFALVGQRLIDRRRRREMGQEWGRLHRAVKQAPVLQWPQRPGAVALRLALGLAAYLVLIVLHPMVIGVSPLP